MTGDDLPVSKPCILADDECYNCEWSTELYVPEAFDEYVKAWFAIKVIAKEFGLGAMDGFQFNMSVGYDLDGIKTGKIDTFIEGLKDAGETKVFKECSEWLENSAGLFRNFKAEDVKTVSPHVCNLPPYPLFTDVLLRKLKEFKPNIFLRRKKSILSSNAIPHCSGLNMQGRH